MSENIPSEAVARAIDAISCTADDFKKIALAMYNLNNINNQGDFDLGVYE